jgi:hypothetical protein
MSRAFGVEDRHAIDLIRKAGYAHPAALNKVDLLHKDKGACCR